MIRVEMGNENPVDQITFQTGEFKTSADWLAAIDQQANLSELVEIRRMVASGRGYSIPHAKTSYRKRLHVI
jgi:hypothetical protein